MLTHGGTEITVEGEKHWFMMLLSWVTFFIVMVFLGLYIYRRWIQKCLRRRRMQETMGVEINYTGF